MKLARGEMIWNLFCATQVSVCFSLSFSFNKLPWFLRALFSLGWESRSRRMDSRLATPSPASRWRDGWVRNAKRVRSWAVLWLMTISQLTELRREEFRRIPRKTARCNSESYVRRSASHRKSAWTRGWCKELRWDIPWCDSFSEAASQWSTA